LLVILLYNKSYFFCKCVEWQGVHSSRWFWIR
jgi:hypothetical protein